MQRFLLTLLLALSFPTQAQMYSWREGASLKVSNNPPNWYRVDRPVRGPRVVVTQGKRVTDDTGLSMEERLRMRPVMSAQAPAPRAPVRN
jgi:hypothetical protein